MLTYSFEDMEDMGISSMYEYLYASIKRDILEGKLTSGEKLPSKRSFARNLGVSTITVENAYAQLTAEGYIYSKPKSGYYVEEIRRHMLVPEQLQTSRLRNRQGNCIRAEREGTKNSGPEQQPDSERSSQKMIDLSGRTLQEEQFPFAVWARLMRRVLSEQRMELMTPAPGQGLKRLRTEISVYLKAFHGMEVTPDRVIIGAGTEYLYGLLIQLLGQEEIYALENPGYRKVDQVYRSHLVRTAYIPMDECGVDMEALNESGADVVHISPSHHYPTGITTTIARRYELLTWAEESNNRYIIEDDYDCEFRLAGKPIPSLQSIDRCGKVIYMNTFSKSLTPTIRISYMILPETLMNRFQTELGFYSCTVSNFEQCALAEFIGGGYFEKHINRMRTYYRNKRDQFLEILSESSLGKCVKIFGADAGLHVLMQVNSNRTEEELLRMAEEQGVQFTWLSAYNYRKEQDTVGAERMEKKLIMNYAELDLQQMKTAVKRLSEAWCRDC